MNQLLPRGTLLLRAIREGWLMELIVLNIGLDLRVISPTLFAMMVLMALVATMATTPILQLLTPGSSHPDHGPELAKLSWATIWTAVLGTFPKTRRGNGGRVEETSWDSRESHRELSRKELFSGEFGFRTGHETEEDASTEGGSAL